MNNQHASDKSSCIRHGSSLEHGKAHFRDHQRWSRRSFLRSLGIAGGASMILGNLPLTAFANSPLHFAMSKEPTGRVLVLIRLKGGNDGLNCIIPVFDYDFYANQRPGIRIPMNNITMLDGDFGMPYTMTSLRNLWDDGKMKIVNNVGYPDQNLSHFRSTDIWSSASDADVVDDSGWLGRYLGGIYPDYLTNPPDQPPAIQIGGVGSIVFNDTDSNNLSVNVSNPEELYEIAQNGRLYDVEDLPDCYFGEQLGYLRAVANSTYIYAGVIKEAYDASSNQAEYGNGPLREQLALVARLIKGGLKTNMYMVNLDGFDTHANQPQQHPLLLEELAAAVDAFYQDLAAGGRDEDVLSFTFSEFGRRVQQNASQGTDHGTSAPVLLFGQGLNGSGVVGDKPDMRALDPAGNMIFSTDFREIYTSVLENWLCIDSITVDQTMGHSFNRINLGLECASTSVFNVPQLQIEHQARYTGGGQINIFFRLPRAMKIKVQIFNILGQPLADLYNGFLPEGEHQIPFYPESRYARGHYIYRIEADGQAFSRAIAVVRG